LVIFIISNSVIGAELLGLTTSIIPKPVNEEEAEEKEGNI
jgi:hypothetical protein